MSALDRSAEAWASPLLYVQRAASASVLVLVVCAVNEIGYAINHPHRYGPAVVLAAACLASAVVAACVGMVAYVLANPRA